MTVWMGLRRRVWWQLHRRDERSHLPCNFQGHVNTLHNWHMALAGKPLVCPVCRMPVPVWGPSWEDYQCQLVDAQRRLANRVIVREPQETDSGWASQER